MFCSCHINPPCGWCITSFECLQCLEIKGKEELFEKIERGLGICFDCSTTDKTSFHICEYIDPGFGYKLWCKYEGCKNEKNKSPSRSS